MVVGRLQQQSWTAEDGSARSTVEVVAEELGPSLRGRRLSGLIDLGPFSLNPARLVVCLTSVGLLSL
jgi:hypothetical protein